MSSQGGLGMKKHVVATMAAIAAGFLGGMLAGQVTNGAVNAGKLETLEIRGISVVDENGDPRIVLAATSGGGVLRLLDSSGRPRLGLSAKDAEVIGCVLFDETNTGRVGMTLTQAGKASIGFSDSDWKAVSTWAYNLNQDASLLSFHGKDGSTRLALGMRTGRVGIASIRDNRGKVIWSAP